jgi:ATP-binding protein involved in chromosome partitioning
VPTAEKPIKGATMSTDDLLKPLDDLPDAGRIRSRRMTGPVATVMADASGLSPGDQQALEARLKAAALAIPGVEQARVALTASKPGRTLIAIGSGKGGVGKSTLAANLAVALARMGKKVGMIDADIYGPSQPTLLNSHDKPRAEKEKLIPVETHGIRMLSVGQLVSPGMALAWRGPMASSALNQLVEADWGDTELILVDLPPGTGDVQLSLIDAARAIDLFGKTHVPVLGIIENMAGYACPHCGESSDPFGQGGAEASAKELGIAFLGRLPLSTSLREASDAGTPPAAGDGPAAEAFAAIARQILAELEKVAG